MGKKLSVREIALIGVLVLIVLYFVYNYVFLVPTNEQIEKYKADALALDDQIIEVDARVAHKNKMQKEIDEVLASGTQTNGLSQYDNRDSVMREFSYALERTLSYSVRFEDTYEVDGIVRRNITLNYTCVNYEAAKNILTYLHDTDYTCLFRDVYIANNAEDETCTITVNVTYFEYI